MRIIILLLISLVTATVSATSDFVVYTVTSDTATNIEQNVTMPAILVSGENISYCSRLVYPGNGKEIYCISSDIADDYSQRITGDVQCKTGSGCVFYYNSEIVKDPPMSPLAAFVYVAVAVTVTAIIEQTIDDWCNAFIAAAMHTNNKE